MCQAANYKDVMNKLLIILIFPMLSACEIDNRASQTEFNFVSYVRFVCGDAEFQKKQYDRFFFKLPRKQREPIENRLSQTTQQCTALEPIKHASLETYEKLRGGIYWPKTVHLFKLSYLLKDEKHLRMVGFFGSKEECEAGRTSLKNVGYKVAPCYTRVLFWKVAWA